MGFEHWDNTRATVTREQVFSSNITLNSSTTETSLIAAGGSGIYNDICLIVVSNTSASTNTRIDFRDATGGTVIFSLMSIGGQQPIGFSPPIPIPQTTANTAWTAQCATSTADIRIYVVYFKSR